MVKMEMTAKEEGVETKSTMVEEVPVNEIVQLVEAETVVAV